MSSLTPTDESLPRPNLPVEVYCDIFSYCIEGLGDDIPDTTFGNPVESPIFRLRQVCRGWRDTLASRMFWGVLSMDLTLHGPWVYGHGDRFMRWLEMYLRRSGSYPLTLRVKDVGGPVIPRLLRESQRWRSVSLSYPRGVYLFADFGLGFGALEELTVEGGGVQEFNDAPRLRSVTLRDISRLPIIPWAQLTDLKCAGMQFPLLPIIRDCSQLLRLTIEEFTIWGAASSSTYDITSNLQSLSIENYNCLSHTAYPLHSFLDRLTLPLLQSLRMSTLPLTDRPNWPLARFVSLLNRSQCQLTSLYLKTSVALAELLELFALQPTLENITVIDRALPLTPQVPVIDESFLTALTRTPGIAGPHQFDLLPRLTHLALVVRASLSSTAVLEMLRSRYHSNPHTIQVPLQSVALGFLYDARTSTSKRFSSTDLRLKEMSELLGQDIRLYSESETS